MGEKEAEEKQVEEEEEEKERERRQCKESGLKSVPVCDCHPEPIGRNSTTLSLKILQNEKILFNYNINDKVPTPSVTNDNKPEQFWTKLANHLITVKNLAVENM